MWTFAEFRHTHPRMLEVPLPTCVPFVDLPCPTSLSSWPRHEAAMLPPIQAVHCWATSNLDKFDSKGLSNLVWGSEKTDGAMDSYLAKVAPHWPWLMAFGAPTCFCRAHHKLSCKSSLHSIRERHKLSCRPPSIGDHGTASNAMVVPALLLRDSTRQSKLGTRITYLHTRVKTHYQSSQPYPWRAPPLPCSSWMVLRYGQAA